MVIKLDFDVLILYNNNYFILIIIVTLQGSIIFFPSHFPSCLRFVFVLAQIKGSLLKRCFSKFVTTKVGENPLTWVFRTVSYDGPLFFQNSAILSPFTHRIVYITSLYREKFIRLVEVTVTDSDDYEVTC